MLNGVPTTAGKSTEFLEDFWTLRLGLGLIDPAVDREVPVLIKVGEQTD